MWGLERFLDEHLWLGQIGQLGSQLVQIAGVALSLAGLVLLASRFGPYRRWRAGRPDPVPSTDTALPDPAGTGARSDTGVAAAASSESTDRG